MIPRSVVHRTTAAKDHFHPSLLILTAFGIASGSAAPAVHTEVGVGSSCQKISDTYGTDGPKRSWGRVERQDIKEWWLQQKCDTQPSISQASVPWVEGVVRNFNTSVSCTIDTVTEEAPDYDSFSGYDSRKSCRQKVAPLNLSNVVVRCQGGGCTLSLGTAVCPETPSVISARFTDGFKVDHFKGTLGSTAVATRELDMAEAEVFWVKCMGHVSYTLGVNKADADRKLANARSRRVRYRAQPPDIYIFLMDSTARSGFHRSFQPLVQELRALQEQGETEVYEFFRQTSVAWGTAPNTNSFFRGAAQYPGGDKDFPAIVNAFRGGATKCKELGCAHPKDREFAPLSEFLRSVGYVTLGQDEDYTKEFPGEMYELVHFGRGCSAFGRFQLDAQAEWLQRMDAYYTEIADDVPRYFAMHSAENHGGKADGLQGQSSVYLQLLTTLNLRKTVLILTADHGKDGNLKGMHMFDNNNPLQLWMVPPDFVDPAKKSMVRRNEQALTTNFDTHLTLKNIPARYTDPTDPVWLGAPAEMCADPKMNSRCYNMSSPMFPKAPGWHFGRPGLGYGLPPEPWMFDFFSMEIPIERSCADAWAQPTFCNCATIPIHLSKHQFPEFGHAVVDTIAEVNRVTGKGKLLCQLLHAEDFEISNVVQMMDSKTRKLKYEVGIQHRTHALHYNAELTGQKRLMQGATKFGQKMGQMKRIDMFKLECCLSDCDGVPPWFNQKIDGFDAVPGIVEEQPWLQPGYTTQHPELYLRLCRCKDSKCLSRTDSET